MESLHRELRVFPWLLCDESLDLEVCAESAQQAHDEQRDEDGRLACEVPHHVAAILRIGKFCDLG
eukprot:CAMPEP_0195648968 /NCGR_PEP_ID=MMETSP0815-20121206/30930_1 /TAXON_ID=97485 /ORGANISM="Prymnesium parvum, Strain Texoma1" /LENGTH=64 /DNA_ID=CAMNT_0040792669 /DNA_START=467 /DNA_END=657 /DNA_ORIENTATION=-